MKGIFRYPGGKTRPEVRKWILGYRPDGVREYREPFVGGGGIFFGVQGVERRWINDRHEGLVAVYAALRDRPEEFIAACREISPASPGDERTGGGERGGQPVNARLKAVFDRLAFDPDADPALRYFFVNRTVFAGRVNYDIPSRLYFSNETGWDIVHTDRLERAARHVAGVRITSGDFAPLLSEPGEDVWVYCDPPYVVNTEMTRTSQLYQYGFSESDHRRFAAAVRASPHRVAVSYDDDGGGFVRSLFPESEGFRVVRGSWAYSGTTSETKERGKELLILNYDPPGGLLTLLSVGGGEADGDLSEAEVDELSAAEAEIADALRGMLRDYLRVGRSLRRIRDRRTYRADYRTFEDYCKRRWGFTPQHAGMLMRAATTVESLETIVSVAPVRESQVRELTRLEANDQRVRVWESALAAAEGDPEKVTAKMVRAEVDKFLPPAPQPEPPDWRRALRKAWESVPAGDRGAAREFFMSLSESEVGRGA